MKKIFHFKKRICSNAKIHVFEGTWDEFEEKHPGVFIVKEEDIDEE